MTQAILVIVLGLFAAVAVAQDTPVGNDTPAADQAKDKAETTAVTAGGDAKKEFKPPPGFTTKKRGEFVLYCKKDSTVGTRFKTEKCYDEDQIREYLLALEIQKRDVERVRSVCSNPAVCSPQ